MNCTNDELYIKTIKVIHSCTTPQQQKVAFNYMVLAQKALYKDATEKSINMAKELHDYYNLKLKR